MAGIYRPEVVRIHAIVAQPPDLEILDHDVGPARKLTDLSLSLRRGHVDRDGALAAIASMEIGRAEIGAVRCRHEGRPQPRVSSPTPGRSTLRKSAPRSARSWQAQGPARMRASSRTRTPSKGRGTHKTKR